MKYKTPHDLTLCSTTQIGEELTRRISKERAACIAITRKLMGWSTSQLAAITNCSQCHINQIELGLVQTPTAALWQKLCILAIKNRKLKDIMDKVNATYQAGQLQDIKLDKCNIEGLFRVWATPGEKAK